MLSPVEMIEMLLLRGHTAFFALVVVVQEKHFLMLPKIKEIPI